MVEQEKYNALFLKYRNIQSKYQTLLKKQKKKLEFMQKLCIASWILMAVTIFADIKLAWFEHQPIPSTTQALIGFVTVFINGGYVTQNICRNLSLNKCGLRIPDGGGKHYMEKLNTTENCGIE